MGADGLYMSSGPPSLLQILNVGYSHHDNPSCTSSFLCILISCPFDRCQVAKNNLSLPKFSTALAWMIGLVRYPYFLRLQVLPYCNSSEIYCLRLISTSQGVSTLIVRSSHNMQVPLPTSRMMYHHSLKFRIAPDELPRLDMGI